MSDAICQRCQDGVSSWNVRQAEFHVGRIEHWKVQLCPKCMVLVEQAVQEALAAERKAVTP